ncbi:MAG: guanylate kinase [Planctomycetota bacterium]
MPATPGKLVIISGPSGVGKSTIVPLVRQRFGPSLRMSVSATTRPPRPGEVDGENYHFLTGAEFQQRLAAGEFIEAIEVFGRGHWYGTPESEVLPRLREGVWVILEIDVEGAARVVSRYPEAVTIFIAPAEDAGRSIEELERRLRARGTESEEALARRLEVARRELDRADDYTHVVVNQDIQQAVDQICNLLQDTGLPPSSR